MNGILNDTIRDLITIVGLIVTAAQIAGALRARRLPRPSPQSMPRPASMFERLGLPSPPPARFQLHDFYRFVSDGNLALAVTCALIAPVAALYTLPTPGLFTLDRFGLPLFATMGQWGFFAWALAFRMPLLPKLRFPSTSWWLSWAVLTFAAVVASRALAPCLTSNWLCLYGFLQALSFASCSSALLLLAPVARRAYPYVRPLFEQIEVVSRHNRRRRRLNTSPTDPRDVA